LVFFSSKKSIYLFEIEPINEKDESETTRYASLGDAFQTTEVYFETNKCGFFSLFIY